MSDDSAVLRAQQLLDIHRPQEALRALASTLANDPANMSALCLASLAQLELDEPELARGLATQAVKTAPDEEWPRRLLALAFARLHRSSEAFHAAQSAVALAPNAWQAHHTLASIAADLPGREEVALASARKAIELAPFEAETHAMLGRVALESGDKATARSALREALRLDPDHAGARNELGRLQMLRKDHFGAADHFAAAAAIDVRLTVAQHNIDVAVTAAVGRIVFWVSIVVFVIGRFAVKPEFDGAVGFGYAMLAAFAVLVVWQAATIVPALRGRLGPYLRSLPRRDRAMTATIGLLVLGLITLMVMCVLPPDSRFWPLMVGAAALIGSRVLLEVRGRRLMA